MLTMDDEKSATSINVLTSLEELACGAQKTVHVRVVQDCKRCHSETTNQQLCTPCNGQGKRVLVRFNKTEDTLYQICDQCFGIGTQVEAAPACDTCQACGFEMREATAVCSIQPGMLPGDEVALETPSLNGAIHCKARLQLKPHSHFHWRAEQPYNLYMKAYLPLSDALLGFDFTVAGLDGQALRIKSIKDRIYHPGETIELKNVGLLNPLTKARGSLIVELCLNFPLTLEEFHKKNTMNTFSIKTGKTATWSE